MIRSLPIPRSYEDVAIRLGQTAAVFALRSLTNRDAILAEDLEHLDLVRRGGPIVVHQRQLANTAPNARAAILQIENHGAGTEIVNRFCRINCERHD